MRNAEDAVCSTVALTTSPGLEDVVAAELGERAAAAGIDPAALAWHEREIGGRLRVDLPLPAPAARELALSLRSVHHVLHDRLRFDLPETGALEAVEARLAALDWPGMDATTPFRVSSDRHGDHDFTSQQVQAAAGAGVVAATGAPVDLHDYRVHVQVDVVGRRCLVGVRWTERELGLRFERVYNQRVALKPPIAYAMLRLAWPGARPPREILDPFCGTGTVLLEAAALFPSALLLGADGRDACVEGTRRNLAAAGRVERARLECADARAMAQHHEPGSLDLIATNPPYGHRLGRRLKFVDFYRDCLEGAATVLRPGGRMVVLVGRQAAFGKALARVDALESVHQRTLSLSGIRVRLVVLERLAG